MRLPACTPEGKVRHWRADSELLLTQHVQQSSWLDWAEFSQGKKWSPGCCCWDVAKGARSCHPRGTWQHLPSALCTWGTELVLTPYTAVLGEKTARFLSPRLRASGSRAQRQEGYQEPCTETMHWVYVCESWVGYKEEGCVCVRTLSLRHCAECVSECVWVWEMGGLQREGALRSRETCCHPAGRGQFGAISAAGQGFLPTEATAEDTAFLQLQHEGYSSTMNFQVELRRHFSSLQGARVWALVPAWQHRSTRNTPEAPTVLQGGRSQVCHLTAR